MAAVAGFGGAVVLLPVLVWVFGARDAVPILTVAQLVGNLSRVYFNRRELVWPVAGWFAVGAIPSSVIGALLFVAAPTSILTKLLGVFLLASVAYRHTKIGRQVRVSQRGFVGVGCRPRIPVGAAGKRRPPGCAVFPQPWPDLRCVYRH